MADAVGTALVRIAARRTRHARRMLPVRQHVPLDALAQAHRAGEGVEQIAGFLQVERRVAGDVLQLVVVRVRGFEAEATRLGVAVVEGGSARGRERGGQYG